MRDMKTEEPTPIPDKYIDIARELCRVAKRHQLGNMHFTIRPEFGSAWRDDINISWEQGRHGVADDIMIVQSQVTTRRRIDGEL